jgi:Cu(I)-responsive transcriptional regulator
VRFLKIGDVARLSGVGIETIRYYEKEGLLAAPARRPSGYRQYDDAAVQRLQFIRQSKQLGFSLSEIRELLRLWFDANSRCVHVRALAEARLADINQKIDELDAMRQKLAGVLAECQHQAAIVDCPIFDVLGRQTSSTSQ